MKILILSSCSNEYRPMGNIAKLNKEEYAQRYGYDYIEDEVQDYKTYPHPSWTKIDSINKYIDKYDWIFWTDIDSLIMNFNIKLEDYIDSDYNFIGSIFYSLYSKCNVFHAGNFLIKCNQQSKNILNESFITLHSGHPLREEWGMTNVFKRYGINKVAKIYPERAFATWVQDEYIFENKLCKVDVDDWFPYEQGDFINHFGAVIPFQGRVFLMKKYSRLVLK